MNLKILPMPQPNSDKKYITQAGVGLCAYKTTEQKAEAAAVFAKWLTESERNLNFAAETGYMPVTNEAFGKINDYCFKNSDYTQLYAAFQKSVENCTAVSESQSPEYYNKLSEFYTYLRESQKSKALYDSNAETLWEKLKTE